MKIALIFLFLELLMSCNGAKLPEPIIKEPKPTFTISDITVIEGVDTIIEVEVILDGKHPGEIQIPYIILPNTAELSLDYIAVDGVLIFRNMDSIETQSILLEIIDDEIFENDEGFEIVFDIDTTVVASKTELEVLVIDDDVEYTDNDYKGYVTLRNREGYNLFWSDEFGGDELNKDNWIQADRGNWYNNELQYYSPNNSLVADGLLTIIAKEENVSEHKYTSSRLWTQHKVFFQYGRVDFRVKLPYGQGLWPALWMMGENRDVVGWSECGEIDIMELKGHTPNQVSSTIHFKNSVGDHQYPPAKKKTLSFGDFSDEFHVFSMEWNQYKIEFFVDDKRYSTIFHNNFSHYNDVNPFQKEFYILMNVAVGGDFGGNPNATTIWPQKMEVDYVRIYKKQ